jgi:hypothetical protein
MLSSRRGLDSDLGLAAGRQAAHTNPKRKRGNVASLPRWRFEFVSLALWVSISPAHANSGHRRP